MCTKVRGKCKESIPKQVKICHCPTHVISGVPQGTVTAPVLFLLMIADIAKSVSLDTRVCTFVDDTRVKKSIADPEVDCPALQADLQAIYSWTEDVGLHFNSKKVECLRYWPGSTTLSQQYLSPDGTPIEEKTTLRDLGVQMSSDCTFNHHIDNVVTSVSKMVGWVLRTFKSRSRLVMMTCWTSLLQSRLDYCSQLWSPSDQLSITKLESVARTFTSHVEGMEGLDYWDRLNALGMYSKERRRERYAIIFIWKLAMGLVKGYDNFKFSYNPRRGWIADPLTINQGAPVQTWK